MFVTCAPSQALRLCTWLAIALATIAMSMTLLTLNNYILDIFNHLINYRNIYDLSLFFIIVINCLDVHIHTVSSSVVKEIEVRGCSHSGGPNNGEKDSDCLWSIVFVDLAVTVTVRQCVWISFFISIPPWRINKGLVEIEMECVKRGLWWWYKERNKSL